MAWLWFIACVGLFVVAIRKSYALKSCEDYKRKYIGLWEQSEQDRLRLQQEQKETIQQANKRIGELKEQNKLTVANSEAILEKAGQERAEIVRVNRDLRQELDSALLKLEVILEAVGPACKN